MRYRIFDGFGVHNYLDAIGEYVYISVHVRGTSVNIQPKGGFILGIKEDDIIDVFICEDNLPNFRNDFTSIRGESIDDCIQQLNDITKLITYQDLLNVVNDVSIGSCLDCHNNREEIEIDFYKYQDTIKNANKIYFDKVEGLIYIILDYKNIINELEEINIFCKNNDITEHWI